MEEFMSIPYNNSPGLSFNRGRDDQNEDINDDGLSSF